MLEGPLPTPKKLAGSYAENLQSIPAVHDEEVLQKLLKALNDSGMSVDEQMEYVIQTNEETQALIDLLNVTTPNVLN
jgi:hypothetical protein